MKGLKLKQNRLVRFLFFKQELTGLVIKYLFWSLKLSFKEKFFFKRLFTLFFSFGGSKVNINNICILTGRFSSVLRLLKISRIKIRDYLMQGSLLGLRKSSW